MTNVQWLVREYRAQLKRVDRADAREFAKALDTLYRLAAALDAAGVSIPTHSLHSEGVN